MAGSVESASAEPASKVTTAEAKAIAEQAFVFGLPLVYIETQIDVLSDVAKPTGMRAPINQFAHYRKFPDASNKTVVGFNVDTLYSFAQLDLSQEPMVLSVPKMGECFWIMQLIDGWNNVPHAPGSRTLGGQGGTFAIVGPAWKGVLPAGLTELRVPTGLTMIGGRTYTSGPDDYAAVNALQDQYRLVPLSAWGRPYTPPDSVPLKPGVDSKTPVPTQVMSMSAATFFRRLNALLVKNPPYAADAPVMALIAKLGIGPGATFDVDTLAPELRKAVELGVAAGRQAIRDQEQNLGDHVNGWNLARDLGRYGTRYTYRAAWTFFGVGGNLIEDAFYPLSLVDGDGHPYDGANAYVLQFAKGKLPPANAFWSLTMYGSDSYLVANPINRYALGDRSKLTPNDDGSLTIFIQSDSPGSARLTNWLPAPKQGGFKLALRLYVPRKEVAEGKWAPPPVQRVV